MTKILLILVCVSSLVALAQAEYSRKSGVAVYGNTNPDPAQLQKNAVKRFASVVELKSDKEQLYRELHANVWPEVQAAIRKANIQNYNIYVVNIDDKKFLFSYLEYTGDDAERDFASIGDDPTTRDKWWPITDDCQKRLPGSPKGEQWLPLEMVMHID